MWGALCVGVGLCVLQVTIALNPLCALNALLAPCFHLSGHNVGSRVWGERANRELVIAAMLLYLLVTLVTKCNYVQVAVDLCTHNDTNTQYMHTYPHMHMHHTSK